MTPQNLRSNANEKLKQVLANKEESTVFPHKPLVSIVLPAFNEEAILGKNLHTLCEYLKTIEAQYLWEMIVVNDGSRDDTGKIAESLSKIHPQMTVFHHPTNFGLGEALRTGFVHCRGDYVIVLDIDLSYSPDHIPKLLDKIQETQAKIVVTSPYSKGGKVSNVPGYRKFLSVWGNRFLALTAKCSLSTLTSMVRVYDGEFLRGLNLKSKGMEVSPEIIYKGVLLGASIEEIPAHLAWKTQKAEGVRRQSSMKVFRHILATLLTGFIFRPFMFFVLPGLALLAFSFYVNGWMVTHFFEEYQLLSQYEWFLDRASVAVGNAYAKFPHTFLVGGLSMMVGIQLVSLGVLSLQSKHYFEEIFHLGTTIYRENQKRKTIRT